MKGTIKFFDQWKDYGIVNIEDTTEIATDYSELAVHEDESGD